MTPGTSISAFPILVIDDDDAVRSLFAITLRKAGFEVIEAAGGVAALEIIEAETVGVVVCDIRMPRMSGIDVTRALRQRPETATLPIVLVTGSGDRHSVVAGLEAGADDFLYKPVDLEELVARVRAHLRTQTAWSSILQDELAVRAGVVAALGSLTLSAVPEEFAEAVVHEISQRTDIDYVSVARVTIDSRMQELASFNRLDGPRRGGEAFPADLADYMLDRARHGPWVEEAKRVGLSDSMTAFRRANLDIIASASVFSSEDLVAMLMIGAVRDESRSSRNRQARLLAAAIDYASVLSAVAGSSIAGQRNAAALRAHLLQVLEGLEFHPVFQPIVEVKAQQIVGFEALTRFDDGVPPDVRFAEAMRAELAAQFEVAAIRMAVEQSSALPPDAFLSLNISPRSLIERADEVHELLASTDRSLIIELTEHVRIENYPELRAAISGLGEHIRVAVDDAGAGFASMRHILELQPSFAKLDISLVRGIDADHLRQALASGLNYYAQRTGCRLIAEGVETQAEADTLRVLGIELGQGYLYGRPQPPADIIRT